MSNIPMTMGLVSTKTRKTVHKTDAQKIQTIRRKYKGLKAPEFTKGARVIFNTYSDSQLEKFNETRGTVVRVIADEKKVDIPDVGWMYVTRLDNGLVIEAFEDELRPINKPLSYRRF